MKKYLAGFLMVLISGWGIDCHAQSLFGNGSILGSSSSGGTSGTGSSGGGNRAGSSGSSSSNSGLFGGSSGSGSTGSGQSRSGQSGSGGGAATGQTNLNLGNGSVAAQVGQSQFAGRSADSAQFVGSQNASSGNAGRNNSQFSLLQGLMNNAEFNPNTNNGTQQSQPIVPQLKLGFVPPAIPPAEIQSTIQTRLVALPSLGMRSAGVSSRVNDQGLVVLSGVVPTEEDRLLMETLIRMEPGVRDVQNNLTITGTR
ncbi:MAG TPA: BON domain-containing protein [Planctomicrobium sp.]|nr:BON domain-containing protein [Planctomicrobium sp.]